MPTQSAVYVDAVRRAEGKRQLPKCRICHAAEGEACTYVSTYDGHRRGDIRPEPHFYR